MVIRLTFTMPELRAPYYPLKGLIAKWLIRHVELHKNLFNLKLNNNILCGRYTQVDLIRKADIFAKTKVKKEKKKTRVSQSFFFFIIIED